jgi:hypothetical protein
MAVNTDRARWGLTPAACHSSALPPVECINDDFVHRFQACSAASDAIWHHGWLACRTDGERGAWIERYADYLEDRLDA